MKLPDINVWLALTLSGHSHHAVARDWLEGENGLACIGFCRTTQQGFLRLLCTEAVLAPYGLGPRTNREAWEIFQSFLTDDRIGVSSEPEGIDEVWERWALPETASPKLWMDAWLAAFAVCGGHQLVTIDRAFRQFDELDLRVLEKG